MRPSYTVVLTSVRTLTCQVEANSEEEAIAFAREHVPLGQWNVARSITIGAMAVGVAACRASRAGARAAGASTPQRAMP